MEMDVEADVEADSVIGVVLVVRVFVSDGVDSDEVDDDV